MTELFTRFAVSALLGAFIGLEREQDAKRMLGIRTFTLVALLGSISAVVGESTQMTWFVALVFLGLALLLAGGRFAREQIKEHPGMTTELAAMVTFGLGVIVYYGPMELAVALGVAVAAFLHYKPQLHSLADRVGGRDLYAIIQFAIVAFVVLPVLPNETFGPLDVLNPYNVWLMVVFISGISLVAYIALRFIGARYGSLASGVLGGFVSSTAVTVSFSQHARREAGFSVPAVLAIVAATAVTLPRVAIEIAVVNPDLLSHMAAPLGLILLACLLPLLICWLRCTAAQSQEVPKIKNPAKVGFAVTFGVIYAVVTLAIAAAQHYMGQAGLLTVGAISGLTDMDAITLSGARLIGQGRIGTAEGVDMILLAFLTNQCTKLAIGMIVGPRRMWAELVKAFAFVLIGTAAAIFLF